MKDDLSCHLNPCFYPIKSGLLGQWRLLSLALTPSPAWPRWATTICWRRVWWSSIYNFNFKYLKLSIQETKIMTSGPITSWQIDGETMETVRNFIFWGSKITTDGDLSHEIKRCLLLGSKAMTNLDSILKSRDITLPTKVCLVKAMVFPVVVYGCESWTKELSTEELMLLNCGVEEDSWESLGLQGDPTSSS